MTACHPECLCALVPFCVHVFNIRGIIEINALSCFLWRDKCYPCGGPPPPYTDLSVPHEGLRFAEMRSPRISCHLGFVYEPLPWKDRLIEDLAQLRSAWFPFPPNKMFHLVPYCLHAGGKVFPISTESNMLVYVSFLAILALKYKKQPNGVNCTKLKKQLHNR